MVKTFFLVAAILFGGKILFYEMSCFFVNLLSLSFLEEVNEYSKIVLLNAYF